MGFLHITTRIFPGNKDRETEVSFQLADEVGCFIGDEVTLRKSDIEDEPTRLEITHQGVELA